MQTPVEKMADAVEQILFQNNKHIHNPVEHYQKENLMNTWREIRNSLIAYETEYIQSVREQERQTLSDLRKENQRLKWLLNVVVDLNLNEGVRINNCSPVDMRWREVRTVQVFCEKYRALLSVVLVTVSFIISEKCGAESVRNFKEAAGRIV